PGDTPVVQTDRGGQVTYHGPGQLMIYPLLDLRRAGLNIRELVSGLERSVVDLAREFCIEASSRREAPGVYVDDRKLASIGLRVRRGASYHGMALNVGLDLEPFSRINPCGYQGLGSSDLASLGVTENMEAITGRLEVHLLRNLGLQEEPRKKPAAPSSSCRPRKATATSLTDAPRLARRRTPTVSV